MSRPPPIRRLPAVTKQEPCHALRVSFQARRLAKRGADCRIYTLYVRYGTAGRLIPDQFRNGMKLASPDRQRFSRRTKLKRVLITTVGVTAAVAVAYTAILGWYDGERIRAVITDRMLERHGVALQIQSLQRSFEPRPLIQIEGLRVANAENLEYELIEVDTASFKVHPWSFVIGTLTFDDIFIDGLRITVPVSEEEGALYWDPLVNAVSEWLHRFDWSLREFEVRNLKSDTRNITNDNDFLVSAGSIKGAMADPADLVLVASDLQANLETTLPLRLTGTARIDRLELGRQRGDLPVTLVIDGSVGDRSLGIRAQGGNLLDGDPMERVPLHASITVGESTTQLDGTMSRDHTTHLDLFATFEKSGNDKDPDLYVEMNISDPGMDWQLTNILARRADSELTGDLLIGNRGERRFSDGTIAVANIEYPEADDESESDDRTVSGVLPKGDLFSNLLDFSEKFDADFRFRAKDTRIYGVTFGQLDIHTLLDHGSLSSTIEKATISDSELSATFNLTPEEGQTNMDFSAALLDASLSALVAGIDQLEGVTGRFDGTIDLRASGHDGESILKSTAGRMVLFLEDGEMPDELATRLAGDVFTALFSDFDRDDTTPIRCAIVDFAVEDGVARSERMIMDTGTFNLYGNGEIQLGEQHLDIKLVPRAKDFSLVSMRLPLRFKGPFNNIEFDPNVSKAVASLLTPIELGLEEDASCEPPRLAAID